MSPSLAEKALEALRTAETEGGLVRVKNGWSGLLDCIQPKFAGLTINALIRKGLLQVTGRDVDARASAVRLTDAGRKLSENRAKGPGGVA